MNLEPQIEKQHLLASCPNCRHETLYFVEISDKRARSKKEELLTCRSCRLVIPVDEFKKLLFSK